jgi:hypothetical protein
LKVLRDLRKGCGVGVFIKLVLRLGEPHVRGKRTLR